MAFMYEYYIIIMYINMCIVCGMEGRVSDILFICMRAHNICTHTRTRTHTHERLINSQGYYVKGWEFPSNCVCVCALPE